MKINKREGRQAVSIEKIKNKYKSLPVQVRASFWFLICSFLQKGISMITTPIFTRIMSTEDYGQFGVFNSWYGILAIIIGLSLSSGVHTQGLIKYSDESKLFSSSLAGLSTLLVFVWFIIYLVFHNFWNGLLHLSTVEMLSMFVLIWTSAIYGLWANEQRVEYKYQILVAVTIISSILKPVIEIFLVINLEDKSSARIIGWCVSDFVFFAWMFFEMMRNGKHFFSKKFWLYALGFNMPLVPHYLSTTVLNSADRIMIERLIGDSETGIYNLAYSLALIMMLFNTALAQTINPWMYKKIKNRKIDELAPIAYSTLILIAVVNLILILLAPEAVHIFAPKTYYEAIWVIPPVSMSVFFMYTYDLFAKFAFYYEKTKVIMVASLIGAILNVVLNYIFINIYGYIAAAYTTLFCFMVFSLSHYIFMKKICREFCNSIYPYRTKVILFISIPFLILGFLFLLTYENPMVRYSIVIIGIISCVIIRKRIIRFAKRIISLKLE